MARWRNAGAVLLAAVLLLAGGLLFFGRRSSREAPGDHPRGGVSGGERAALVPPRGDPGSPVPAQHPADAGQGAVPEAEAPGLPDPVRVVVRDCWDAAPVPGLEFRSRDGEGGDSARGDPAGPPPWRTDAQGEMRIARRSLAAIRPSGDDWGLAKTDPGKVPDGGDLWVYRRAIVRARIRSSAGTRPLDPASASVAFRVAWKVHGQRFSRSPPHQSQDWLAFNGFERLSVTLAYSPDANCHEAKVPVIAGAGVRAAARGWRPAALLLPPSFGTSPVTEVEVVLRPTVRIAGRVLTGDGSPPGPVLVSAYTAIRTDWEGLRTALMAGGGGGSAAASPGGHAEAAFRKSVTIDPAGRFSVEIEAEGETTLVIWDPGFAPLFHPLGNPGESLEGVDLELRPPDGEGGIRILCGGKPLPHHQLFLSDLTHRVFQPGVQIPIGPEGKVLAQWFGRGREYGLGIEGPLKEGPMREMLRDRFLTWNGQDEIEWTDLPLASDVLSR